MRRHKKKRIIVLMVLLVAGVVFFSSKEASLFDDPWGGTTNMDEVLDELHDHDHADDASSPNWVAEILDDDGEVKQELPVLLTRHGVVRLTSYNFFTAIQLAEPKSDVGTQAAVIFWYTQNNGLSEDAHPLFVEAARRVTAAFAELSGKLPAGEDDAAAASIGGRSPRHGASSKRGKREKQHDLDTPIRFGQFDVDPQDAEEASFVKDQGPNGFPLPMDFPFVTVTWRSSFHGGRRPKTMRLGLSGQLTAEGIVAYLKEVKAGWGVVDYEGLEEVLPTVKTAASVEGVAPLTFTDGYLDV